MSYKPENSGAARMWLKQRSVEEIQIEAKHQSSRLIRSRDWLAKYLARGRKTAFNWLPTFPVVTKPKETTHD